MKLTQVPKLYLSRLSKDDPYILWYTIEGLAEAHQFVRYDVRLVISISAPDPPFCIDVFVNDMCHSQGTIDWEVNPVYGLAFRYNFGIDAKHMFISGTHANYWTSKLNNKQNNDWRLVDVMNWLCPPQDWRRFQKQLEPTLMQWLKTGIRP